VVEPRDPQVLCFDVLVQFLMTLAVGDGFYPDETYERIKKYMPFRK
jgi:ATP-dependent Lhr-like helicase